MNVDTITTRQSQEVQAAFTVVNDCLFLGQLPNWVRLQIAYYSRTSDGGHFVANKWDGVDGKKYHEIAIDEHLLTLEKSAWLAPLVHQMVHFCQFEFGKPPNNGRHYHNKEFAEIMRNLGLPLVSLDKDRKEGSEIGQKVDYTIEPEGKFQRMIQVFDNQLIITSQPRNAGMQLMSNSQGTRNNWYKHSCPKCSKTFTSLEQTVNVKCGQCDVKFISAS